MICKKIVVFLFDGFSDWEIAFLTPEINKNKQFELVYCAADGGCVTSVGGLNIKPDVVLHDLQADEIDMLVLPGGAMWERGEAAEINGLLKQLFEQDKAIAAICAATTRLGQLGLLDHLQHTSNDLNYLKQVAAAYCGEQHYQFLPAVSDKKVITTSGIAPIEFAKEIFKLIGLYDDEKIETWFQLFKNGVWAG